MDYFTVYVNLGISVLPIALDGTKRPAVKSWNQYRKKRASPDEIAQWNRSGYGVAIVGGHLSEIECIDIDDPTLVVPFIKDARRVWPDFENYVAIIATPRRDPETGNGGAHVIFRTKDADGNTKLAMSAPHPEFDDNGEHVINPTTGEPRFVTTTLIETRGEGGYFLTVGCPPACHPSGNVYEHRMGKPFDELPLVHRYKRELLMRVARMFDRSQSSNFREPEQETAADSPGSEYAARVSWEDILIPHGWAISHVAADRTLWRRPGKSSGTSATTGLKSAHGNELLCVFSTNASPFPGPSAGDACSTHGKFDAYAVLNHGGDHSLAAKTLAAEGYGRQSAAHASPAQAVKPITFSRADAVQREYIQALADQEKKELSTGIAALDDAIGGGVSFGELVIIGGRPTHGKTMLALQLLSEFATQDHKSLLLAEDMSNYMIAKRLNRQASPIREDDWVPQRNALLYDVEQYWKDRLPWYIAPKCGTLTRVVETVEKAADQGIRIVCLDYAQQVSTDAGSRYESVTEISSEMRTLTARLDILLLMVCQLNRGNERGQTPPRSIDLRDSGQLEQDADVILLVDWPRQRGEEGVDKNEWHVRIDKNRNRETKKRVVKLVFNPSRQTVSSPPEPAEPEPVWT